MVCLSMGSSFSWLDVTLGADGAALGVGMNTLGSEAWGWIGALGRIGRSTERRRVGVGGGGGTGATCIDEGRVGWDHH